MSKNRINNPDNVGPNDVHFAYVDSDTNQINVFPKPSTKSSLQGEFKQSVSVPAAADSGHEPVAVTKNAPDAKSYKTRVYGKNDPNFEGLTAYIDSTTNEIAAFTLPGFVDEYFMPTEKLQKVAREMDAVDKQGWGCGSGEHVSKLAFAVLSVSHPVRNLKDEDSTIHMSGAKRALQKVHDRLVRDGAKMGLDDNPVHEYVTRERQALQDRLRDCPPPTRSFPKNGLYGRSGICQPG